MNARDLRTSAAAPGVVVAMQRMFTVEATPSRAAAIGPHPWPSSAGPLCWQCYRAHGDLVLLRRCRGPGHVEAL